MDPGRLADVNPRPEPAMAPSRAASILAQVLQRQLMRRETRRATKDESLRSTTPLLYHPGESYKEKPIPRDQWSPMERKFSLDPEVVRRNLAIQRLLRRTPGGGARMRRRDDGRLEIFRYKNHPDIET